MHLCPHCGIDKPLSDFYVRSHNGRPSAWCKDCTKASSARIQSENYPEARAYQRTYWSARRDEALALLGGRCVVCGEDDPIVLQIDHVDGGGFADRRRRSKYAILSAVISGEDGYQLLCANDHVRKTRANGEHFVRA